MEGAKTPYARCSLCTRSTQKRPSSARNYRKRYRRLRVSTVVLLLLLLLLVCLLLLLLAMRLTAR
jgi:hypothetical protein